MKNRTLKLFKLSTGLFLSAFFAIPAFAASLTCTQAGADAGCSFDWGGAAPASSGYDYGDHVYTPSGAALHSTGGGASGSFTITGLCSPLTNDKDVVLCDDTIGPNQFNGGCDATEVVATSEVVCAAPASPLSFSYVGPSTAADRNAAAFNQLVAFVLLTFGALLGLGLTIAGIWWGYHKVKSVLSRRRGENFDDDLWKARHPDDT